MYQLTLNELVKLKLSPAHEFFVKLARNPRVAISDSLSLSVEQRDALQGVNVISLHDDGTYSAHSRYVQTFFKKAAVVLLSSMCL